MVALTESDSSGSVSSRARETLVLPPPGAEASTRQMPRRGGSAIRFTLRPRPDATHSTFAACSLSRSIAALRSRPIRVSGTEADLEQSVFASRTNSWVEEVELAAGALAGVQQGAGGLDMGGEPVQLLPHVGFLRQQRDLLGQALLRHPGAAGLAQQRGELFQQLLARCASGWPTASAAAASRSAAISASSPARITCSLAPSAWRAATRPASAAS